MRIDYFLVMVISTGVVLWVRWLKGSEGEGERLYLYYRVNNRNLDVSLVGCQKSQARAVLLGPVLSPCHHVCAHTDWFKLS